jgi:hypothetical protein
VLNTSLGHKSDVSQVPQPNPLEQDIADLKRLAESSKSEPSERQQYAEAVRFLEESAEQSQVCAQLARELGVSSEIEKWSDEQLAMHVADIANYALKGKPSLLYHAMCLDTKPESEALGLSNSQFLHYVGWLFSTYSLAILDEFHRRRLQNEDASGYKVRELLVEKNRRGELLANLSNDESRGLWLFGERAEAQAMAAESIWADVYQFVSAEPVVTDPKYVVATMKGALNLINKRARDRISERLRKEHRQSERVVFESRLPGPTSDDDESFIEAAPSREFQDRPLRTPSVEQGLFVEEIRSRAKLSKEDEELVDLIEIKGYTQEEAAQELRILQGTVSKRHQKALEKLRQAVD